MDSFSLKEILKEESAWFKCYSSLILLQWLEEEIIPDFYKINLFFGMIVSIL